MCLILFRTCSEESLSPRNRAEDDSAYVTRESDCAFSHDDDAVGRRVICRSCETTRRGPVSPPTDPLNPTKVNAIREALEKKYTRGRSLGI